ncbi:MAG: flavodoxin family protein [Candidatus Bathyarchaeota archaeon]
MSKKQVHVLGLVGSPRRGGNTDTLVDEVLRGASEAGAPTEKVRFSDLDIRPCDACDACRGGSPCPKKDDFNGVLEKMRLSSVWVLGTPVYWWGPTAQTKAFIDRWYGVDKALFRGKKVVLVVPSGGGSSYSDTTVEMLESIASYLGMRRLATIRAPGTSSPGSARSDEALMRRARALGDESVKR